MERGFTNISLEDLETNKSVYTRETTLPGYIFWYVTVANLCIFVVGVVGNVLVLSVIIRHKEMRTHMNCLLCNLCIADLQVLLICQPAGMAEFYGKDRWYLGSVMCKYTTYLCHALAYLRSGVSPKISGR